MASLSLAPVSFFKSNLTLVSLKNAPLKWIKELAGALCSALYLAITLQTSLFNRAIIKTFRLRRTCVYIATLYITVLPVPGGPQIEKSPVNILSQLKTIFSYQLLSILLAFIKLRASLTFSIFSSNPFTSLARQLVLLCQGIKRI